MYFASHNPNEDTRKGAGSRSSRRSRARRTVSTPATIITDQYTTHLSPKCSLEDTPDDDVRVEDVLMEQRQD